VAHTCNPNYSGGKEEENLVQSQSRQIVLETLSQKNVSQKRAGGVAQGVGLSTNPSIPPLPPHKRLKNSVFLTIQFPLYYPSLDESETPKLGC
jgi:hypothetical protein